MTEAVLLKALAAGESVQAHAARRRVSVHTVRSHIAALPDKLGCRSQLELATLARALPPWRQR
jgi:DNA-binding NarL/FixJ family response regulator